MFGSFINGEYVLTAVDYLGEQFVSTKVTISYLIQLDNI